MHQTRGCLSRNKLRPKPGLDETVFVFAGGRVREPDAEGARVEAARSPGEVHALPCWVARAPWRWADSDQFDSHRLRVVPDVLRPLFIKGYGGGESEPAECKSQHGTLRSPRHDQRSLCLCLRKVQLLKTLRTRVLAYVRW